MQDLKVTLVQSPIHWENPVANREMFEQKIDSITGPVDIIVLPEVFTTGFTMDPSGCAEKYKGETFQWMKHLAEKKDSILVGSLPTLDNGKYYNRMIWMQPDSKFYKYDKKHLFTFAGETKNFTPGKEKVVVEYQGWKICLLICYDLRFPVWCKNSYNPETGFEYDCIINIANWPAVRSQPWSILLKARAIENQAYVVGVNRIGKDGKGNDHSGDSALICPAGETLSKIKPNEEVTETVTMDRKHLEDFREKFRIADDWDKFKLID